MKLKERVIRVWMAKCEINLNHHDKSFVSFNLL